LRWENHSREQGLISDDWVAKRTSEARPVLDAIKQLLDEQRGKAPPKGLLGKAIAYASNFWPRLIVYLEECYERFRKVA